MNEIVFDAEFDGLKPTKMHCISANYNSKPIGTRYDYSDVHSLFNNPSADSTVFIGHNIILYDIPEISRLADINLNGIICIDTLAVSWYLYPLRRRHSLEEWGADLGVPKVQIHDWENLSIQEYTKRCERDVEINTRLWSLFRSQLLEMYGTLDKVYSVCKYLTFKLKQAQKAQERPFRLDVPTTEKNLETLQALAEARIEAIKPHMPPVNKYREMQRPKKPRKADFSLTVVGERWYNICKEQGLNPETTESVKVLTKVEEPNPSSSEQVKNWLFSIGWNPKTFKTNPKGKEVPQLSKIDGSDLCDSVKELIPKYPCIENLDDLFTLNSRIGTLKGFLKNKTEDGYIKAEIAGFTNTLRMRHKTLVNLPSTFSKYGEYIRSCLVPTEGKVFCGSDMSGLEDRTKQHYMMDYDPEYVKEMNTEGFDPHLDIALQGNLMSQKDVDDYRAGVRVEELTPLRHGAKTTNYSCTYGAYPPKIANSANIPLKQAQELWETYWKRNWSIKQIAEDAHVREFNKMKWIWNPVSQMWYWLKYEKDRFSTLNQGTGSYCFDCWIGFILSERPQLTGQFHDEVILEIELQEKEEITNLLKKSINKVNTFLKLKRDLDVDIKFGTDYGQIH